MLGRWIKLVLAVAAVVLLAGSCSTKEDLAMAEREVEAFHKAFNAGQCDAIYAKTTDELKKNAAEADFVAMLQTVERKLGKTTGAKRINWNVNFATSGTTVKLVYDTSFEHGKATETFNYRIAGKKALLMGYDISSKDLLMR